ncbi:MAG: SLATT domain-containing protein [Streptococcus sp.]|nr:MAG: SLATT domain-containing protein [Streptococcus sp.]
MFGKHIKIGKNSKEGGLMSKNQEKLHFELLNFIVNVGWTHKIHAVRIDELESYIRWFRIATIIISGVVSSGLVGILCFDEYWIKLVTAFLSLVTTIIFSITKEFNFEERLALERKSVDELWNLRVSAENLLSEVVYNGKSSSEIQKSFEELKFRRDVAYGKLSNPSPKNISKASELIKSRKDNDYEDDYKYFISKELMKVREEE